VAVAPGEAPVAKKHLEGHQDVHHVEFKDDDGLRVELNDGVNDGSFIAEVLVHNSLKLRMLREEEIDLEDVFMAITKGITN